MVLRTRTIFNLRMLSLATFVFASLYSTTALSQQGPTQFSLSGGLYNPNGTPVTSNSVDFRIEILDPAGTCVLYSEVHNNEDLSNTKGGFALQIGTGTGGVNNVAGGSALTTSVFENNGVTAVAGCAAQTFNSGDNRVVRVSYDLGSGFVAMNPTIPMTAAAYSMVAESVQGKRATDLVQIRNDNSTYYLGQTNIEWIFNNTNWPRLQALLNGNSSQYMVTSPTADVSFNNRKIINVAAPTANTDATNKQYVDGNIAGYGASLTGIGLGSGGGSTLVWDQVDNRWEIGSPNATDNTKLPLAGGTMTGAISMGGFDIYNVGNITMADQRLLRLGSYTSAQEGLLALGTANAGTMFFNSTTGQLRVWNGTDYSGIVPGGAAGGDLTGTYPNPTIANNAITSAKINDGTIATADIGNSQITSAKINNTGIAVNRILVTDATTGGTVTYATCAQDEILKFNSSTGWGCSTAASLIGNTTVTAGNYGSATSVATFTVDAQGRLTAAANTAIAFPVTSVAGRTGAVTLNWADVGGLGTAATYTQGTGAGQIPALDGSARIPAVDGGLLTNVNAVRLQGRTLSSAAPADGTVLRWNNTLAQWEPQAIPSAPVSSVNGKTGVVTIELADIAGAGDMTEVNAGNGLLGGATSGVANLSVNAGTGANQIVQIGSDGVLPVIDGNKLTNLNALRIQNRAISSAAPADLQVLQWNATLAQWAPAAIPSAPVSSVNGKTGVVTIELADIAGAGDITQVVAGTGATGGGTAGIVTVGVNVGTGANQILQLDSNSFVPAVDGNLLTNLNAVRLQGRVVSSTAPADLQVLQWNATTSQWNPVAIPSAPVASVNGKTGVVTIELADIAGAGDMTEVNTGNGLLGGATSGVANLSVNTGTGANQIVQLGADSRIPALDGSLVTNLNAIRIQGRAVAATAPTADQVLRWNNTTSIWEPQTLPAAGITALTGDVVAAGAGSVAATISNNAITSAKINNTGIAVNRLLITDASTGATVTYASCAQDEVLKFNSSTGWGCAPDAGTGASVSYIGAGNGLLGGPISTAGTLSVNTGTGANQIVQIGSDGLLPSLDGANLSNLNAVRIQGRVVSSTAPADLQVLQWNATTSQWNPVAIPSAPVASVNGKTGVVTIELADIAGAGDITQVVAGTGATGGGTAGVVTVGVNVGTGANQVLQLDGNAFVPAVDGNLLTNLNAVRLQGRVVSSTAPADLQVLQWNATTSQWNPVAIPSAPVASVNGKTGVVTIELADIAGAGDMTAVQSGNGLLGGGTSGGVTLSVNAGTGANQIVQIGSDGLLPGLDGANLSNLNAVRIQGRVVSSTAPADLQVLQWNATTSQWNPVAIPSAPVASVNGKTGVVTIELADIAGAGDITEVNTGNGLLGGVTSGIANLSVNAGTGANQIVQLTANSFLPAVDGNLLTNLNAVRLQGRSVSATGPTADQVLRWNNTTSIWEPQTLPAAGITALTGDVVASGAGSVAATISNNAISSAKINSTGIAVNRILMTDASTGGTVTYASCAQDEIMKFNSSTGWGCATDNGVTNAFAQGGNSFSSVATLGTNDSYRLDFETNNSTRMSIDTTGNVGIGTTTPSGRFSVAGANTDNAYFFYDNADVGDSNDGQSLYIYRRAAEGDANIRFHIDQFNQSYIQGSLNTFINTQSGGLHLQWGGLNTYVGGPAYFVGGAVGVGTNSPTTGSILDVAGTGTAYSSMIVPRDTTALRPTVGVNGMIRYNTTTNKFEVYEGVWQNMLFSSAGLGDITDVVAGNGLLGGATAGAATLSVQFPMASTAVGTAAAPAYSFSGDADNGMFKPSTNYLAFSTFGTQRLTIDGSGNIGIGTTSPTYRLEVLGNANDNSTGLSLYNGNTGNNASSAVSFSTADGGGMVGSFSAAYTNTRLADRTALVASSTSTGISIEAGSASHDIRFFAGSAGEAMRINSSGSIGIGTTSSTAGTILDLTGTGVAFSSLIVPRDTTALRPTVGVNGMIRYNTTTAKFEVYEGVWQNMVSSGGGGATNIDGLTDGKTSPGTNSVFLGSNAGTGNLAGGDSNTAVGVNAMAANTTGDGNTAIGTGALSLSTTAYSAVAVGRGALGSLASASGNDVAIGEYALSTYDGTTGDNVAIGGAAMLATTTGGQNVAVGRAALGKNTSGNANVAIGMVSAGGSAGTNNAQQNNTVVGYGAGQLFTTANNNVLLGYDAGGNITTGDNNIVIGYDVDAPVAANSNQLVIGNIIYGTGVNGAGTTVSEARIGIGTNAPTAGARLDINGTGTAFSSMLIPRDTTALRPTGVNGMIRYNTTTQKFEVYEGIWQNMIAGGGGGATDIDGLSDAIYNSTAQSLYIGNSAGTGQANTNVSNVALGYRALSSQNNATSDANVAIGADALRLNQSGGDNVAMGANALGSVTTANQNVAIGTNALGFYTGTGMFNTAVGTYAGWNNTAGGNNSYFGAGAGAHASGDQNTAIGMDALASVSGTPLTGDGNTALGYRALYLVQGDAWNNIAIGHQAADNLTTGDTNLVIGYDIDVPNPTGDNQLVIGNIIYGTGVNGSGTTVSEARIGIGTNSPTAGARLDINGTGAAFSSIIVPRDTTALRPTTGVNGMIRYNTTTNKFEAFEGVWQNLIGGGSVSFPLLATADGTAAAPAYSFSGDADNGMFKPSPNYLAFSTFGTQRMTIDGSGRVGLSTASPTNGTLLDINGTGAAFSSLIVPRDTTALRPTVGVNGMIRYNTTTAKFEAYQAGGWTNMISAGGGDFMSDGSVPMSAPLRASAGSAALPSFTFAGDPNTGLFNEYADAIAFTVGGVRKFVIDPNGLYGADIFLNAYSSTATEPAYALGAGDPDSGMFRAAADTIGFSTGGTERMRLSAAGNVGIGTGVPTVGAKLEIDGTGTLSSSILIPRDTTANRPSGVNGMFRYNTTTNKFEGYENGGWVPVASGFMGKVTYAGATSCVWTSTSASFANYAADTDCATPVATGSASAPGTKVPTISFTNLPPGDYEVVISGQMYNSGSNLCRWRMSDGTTNSGTSMVNLNGESNNLMMATFSYTTVQASITFQPQVKRQSGTGSCMIANDEADITFEIWVKRM